jgi:hypothetical protein
VNDAITDDRSLLQAAVGDGRGLLSLTGLSLVLAGAFAIFLSATGHFLPHDVQFLGMTAGQLCSLHECRIVHFMFHDRVAFGGSLIAVGSIYMWMAEFPLRRGEPWSWWLFLVSGVIGFGSFLAYLGYGYLDTWHGVATLFLLPCFVTGLVRSRSLLPKASPSTGRQAASLSSSSASLNPRLTSIGALLRRSVDVPWNSSFGIGRLCLLATTAGMIAGGPTIMIVGMTSVFVPQDLKFMGLAPADLQAINPGLISLIAHDRAGFGGGICTTGITVLFCVWCAKPSRSLW